ncbi:MAG: hypothetical protein PF569_09625 [Candidatus Woesearchaeota archaeon]|nr:hypothetical protein [Candidatus Woesearchaeota archaeon]
MENKNYTTNEQSNVRSEESVKKNSVGNLLLEDIIRVGENVWDGTKPVLKGGFELAVSGTQMAMNLIPGTIVPSKIREKCYDFEDKLWEKTGLYDDSMKLSVEAGRQIGSAGLGAISSLVLVGLPDFTARLIVFVELSQNGEDYNMWDRNLSKKYFPASFPVELVYACASEGIIYIKNLKERTE